MKRGDYLQEIILPGDPVKDAHKVEDEDYKANPEMFFFLDEVDELIRNECYVFWFWEYFGHLHHQV